MAQTSSSTDRDRSTPVKRLTKADVRTFEGGRVLPQARDLEEAVLGAIMTDREAMNTVAGVLKPESFYTDAHQRIFAAMLALFEDNEPIDILTVSDKLRTRGDLDLVGGAYYVTLLSNKVASSANLEYHGRIVSQKYVQRELIHMANTIIEDAFDETKDVFDLLDEAESSMFAITEENLKKNAQPISTVLTSEIEEIEKRRQKAAADEHTGVGSGFTDLDRITGGWQPSDLIIVAARPGMGKTAFTLTLARNAALDLNKGVAFFSLEMSSNQLVSRLISMETEISGEKLRKGQLLDREWKHLVKNVDALRDAPIYIDDTPAIDIFEIRAKARRLKRNHDIELIVIDYLQLMGGTGDNKNGTREQEISQISRALKQLAKELNIPVIALSQLSRAVETRGGNKRPMLSDLRESGAIEQDADMVIFLYRAEYYKIDQDEDGMDTRGLAEVIISKHRNGSTGTVKTRFIGEFVKFADLEPGVLLPESFSGERITKPSRLNEGGDPFGGGPGGGGGGGGLGGSSSASDILDDSVGDD